MVKAKAAEAEAELEVKAVTVAVKAMDVTAAMVEGGGVAESDRPTVEESELERRVARLVAPSIESL